MPLNSWHDDFSTELTARVLNVKDSGNEHGPVACILSILSGRHLFGEEALGLQLRQVGKSTPQPSHHRFGAPGCKLTPLSSGVHSSSSTVAGGHTTAGLWQ